MPTHEPGRGASPPGRTPLWWRYASPRDFYVLAGRWLPWRGGAAAL